MLLFDRSSHDRAACRVVGRKAVDQCYDIDLQGEGHEHCDGICHQSGVVGIALADAVNRTIEPGVNTADELAGPSLKYSQIATGISSQLRIHSLDLQSHFVDVVKDLLRVRNSLHGKKVF